jgi:hypothetical protein
MRKLAVFHTDDDFVTNLKSEFAAEFSWYHELTALSYFGSNSAHA